MIEEFDTWAPTVGQPASKDVPMILERAPRTEEDRASESIEGGAARGKTPPSKYVPTVIDAQKDE